MERQGTGTFQYPDGKVYRAKIMGAEHNGATSIMVYLPEGHPDRPGGGPLLIDAPVSNFTPDAAE